MIWEPTGHFVPSEKMGRCGGSLEDALHARTPQTQSRWKGLEWEIPHVKSRNLSCPALPWQPCGSGRAVQEGGAWPSPRSRQELHLVLLPAFGMLPEQIQSRVRARRGWDGDFPSLPSRDAAVVMATWEAWSWSPQPTPVGAGGCSGLGVLPKPPPAPQNCHQPPPAKAGTPTHPSAKRPC